MKKVLMIMNSLNCGGQENFVMNCYRKINRNLFQIDFLIPENEAGEQFFEKEIRSNHDRIYKVTSKSLNPIKSFLEVYRIVKHGHYDVVHRHSNNSMMFLDLLAARLAGVKTLLAHSHSSNMTSAKARAIHKLFRPFLCNIARLRIACGLEAGKWMYGEKKYLILKNGIDTKKYVFDDMIRQRIRQQLQIKDEILIGHVGRIDDNKNQIFLIDILSELEKQVPGKYKLVCIGTGCGEEKLRKKIKETNLEKNVILAGQQSNVSQWLQAMDIFVFPSIYEGVPMAPIEAQATGLSCMISDTLSKEVSVSPYTMFFSLNHSAKEWSEKVVAMLNEIHSRDKGYRYVQKNGYDISMVVNKLEKIYNK